jgi:hypothetical protein
MAQGYCDCWYLSNALGYTICAPEGGSNPVGEIGARAAKEQPSADLYDFPRPDNELDIFVQKDDGVIETGQENVDEDGLTNADGRPNFSTKPRHTSRFPAAKASLPRLVN